MILSRELCKKIEQHLYKRELAQHEQEERRLDIIEAVKCPAPYDALRVRQSGHSDKTAAAVLCMDEVAVWMNVANQTFDHYAGTERGRMMTLRYIKRLPPIDITAQLHISLQRYYDWRADVVTFAAFAAVHYGLLSLSDIE